MLDAVSKITFNGKADGLSDAAAWIGALNNHRVLAEKAGFLFKAALDGDHLMLEAAPCLINGARSYHFNMHLEKEDGATLIGMVNAQGVFTILFKPTSRDLSPEQIRRYVDAYRCFAIFLRNAGYSGEGLLDEVTQAILKKLNLSPVPQTIMECRTPKESLRTCT